MARTAGRSLPWNRGEKDGEHLSYDRRGEGRRWENYGRRQGRLMECVAWFSSGGLCETSISRFPWGLIAGELSYSPFRGSRVPSLSAYCFDVCALPASLDIAEMPLYWVKVRSPQWLST